MPGGLGGIKNNDTNLAAIERTYAHASALNLVAECISGREHEVANAIKQLCDDIKEDCEILLDAATKKTN